MIPSRRIFPRIPSLPAGAGAARTRGRADASGFGRGGRRCWPWTRQITRRGRTSDAGVPRTRAPNGYGQRERKAVARAHFHGCGGGAESGGHRTNLGVVVAAARLVACHDGAFCLGGAALSRRLLVSFAGMGHAGGWSRQRNSRCRHNQNKKVKKIRPGVSDRKTSPDARGFFWGIFFWSSRPEHNQRPPTDTAKRRFALIPTRRKIAVSPLGAQSTPL